MQPQMNTDEHGSVLICVHLCSSVVYFVVLVAARLRCEIRGGFIGHGFHEISALLDSEFWIPSPVIQMTAPFGMNESFGTTMTPSRM